MENKVIEALEKKGCNRWTKTTDSGKTYDRLYIDVNVIGSYKYKSKSSGWYDNCEIGGIGVANHRYNSIARFGKIYIDLTDNDSIVTEYCAGCSDIIVTAVKQLIASAEELANAEA